jgi:hypothetical protein
MNTPRTCGRVQFSTSVASMRLILETLPRYQPHGSIVPSSLQSKTKSFPILCGRLFIFIRGTARKCRHFYFDGMTSYFEVLPLYAIRGFLAEGFAVTVCCYFPTHSMSQNSFSLSPFETTYIVHSPRRYILTKVNKPKLYIRYDACSFIPNPRLEKNNQN